jgi:exopolysaccharide production protein ExoZ
MPQQNKNLELIQVLRGIASLLVVFLHSTVNVNSLLKKEFCFNAFVFGGAGVDIFFVLSGFIITYTSIKALQTSRTPLPFLRRRFVRIFPAYWVVITLFLIIQLLFTSFYSSGAYNFTLPNVLATYFLLPDHTMVNGVSWTLTYELFFYFLFSLAFFIPKKNIALWLGILYALIIIVLHCFGYDAQQQQNKWLQLITLPMNTEFVMGIIAALTISKIRSSVALPFLIAGCLLFIGGAILHDTGYSVTHNGFNRVILFGIGSFFIITGLVKYELQRKVEVHSFLLKLGEASYSLYLLHLPLVVACIKIIAKLGITNNIIIRGLLIVAIIIICFGSILFFRFIEKPIIDKLNAYRKTVAK